MKVFGFDTQRNKKEQVNIPIHENFSQQPIIEAAQEFCGYRTSTISVPKNDFAPYVDIHNRGLYYPFGTHNNYPLVLENFYTSSPLHAGIVKKKARIMSGDGISFDEPTMLSIADKELFYRLINFADGKNTLKDILNWMSFDWQLYGSMAVKLHWDMSYTNINKIEHVPVRGVRVGTKCDDNGTPLVYYYSKDWQKGGKAYEYPAFDISNNGEPCQLLYVKNRGLSQDIYGEPYYVPGLNWISTDADVSDFHANNLRNGNSSPRAVTIYKKFKDVADKRKYEEAIKSTFNGPKNAGKDTLLVVESKELKPDYDTLPVNNNDKSFISLLDKTSKEIMFAHGIKPVLVDTVPGQLGNVDELKTAYTILESEVIGEDRDILERTINRIFKVNSFGTNIKIDPYDLFKQNNTNV